jgi:alpha-tubulin suppressor-like RCC1 family protein
MNVRQLFGAVPVQVGRYRVRVVSGSAGAQIKFSVVTTPISRLSAGADHTCHVSAGGTVSCWGDNAYGELGDGTTINRETPVTVPGIAGASAVSAGSHHTCALLAGSPGSTAGTVSCWGWNSTGQLGNATKTDSSTPVPVTGLSDATAVSTGGTFVMAFSCALREDRTVSCWGSNHDGELGNGSTVDSPVPVRVEGLSNVLQISAGLRHACALLTSAAVECWGFGTDGQLGNGEAHDSSVPVRVKGISTAIQVSAGGTHSCALLGSGAIKCWGDNGMYQLGIGKRTPLRSAAPVVVKMPGPAVAVSAGWGSSCALRTTGVTYCWGSNGFGELGAGAAIWESIGSGRPLLVKQLSKVSALSVGGEDACASTVSGAIKCWGANTLGQLGNGTSGRASTPVVANGITNATAVSSEYLSTCAVLTNGRISCWGLNSSGQLGVSSKVKSRPIPALVPGVANAVGVADGGDHACALISGGTVLCWGGNKSGELGNGTKVGGITPVKVKGISNALQIGASQGFSCALLANHAVKCWGTNYASQLGNGTTTSSTTPTGVSGISDAVELDVGGNTSCVVNSDGTVECWGGYDPTDPMSDTGTALPTPVQGVTNAVKASITSHCALISDGTVTCWGEDSFHSDGSIRKITGLANGIDLSASCALISGGGVDCWGSSEYGQLGNGTVSVLGSSDSAVPVSGISNATAVGASGFDACAVLADGRLECWGSNDWGQLGNGEQGFSAVPVSVIGLG